MIKKQILALGLVRYVCLLFVIALGFTTIVATGGGGSSSSTGDTGSVAVLIADGPADDYDEIQITIEKAFLIPFAGDPLLIFEGSITRDLLELRDNEFLLRLKDDVPVGVYEKIRLEVSDIQPVGGPCDTFDVKLPSGRIDLNPREPISVMADRTVYIRLDIDANKSINLHEAGSSGKCIFRPVVFVEVSYDEPPRRCPQIFRGTILGDPFDGNDDGQVDTFILTLTDGRGKLTINLLEDSRIFGADGLFTDPNLLQQGQFVNVRGRLWEDEVVASLVAVGQVYHAKGTVEGEVANDRFPFRPDPLAGIVVDEHGHIAVELVRDGDEIKTLILIGCDTEVGSESIMQGMRARVVYKLVCGNDVCWLRAVAVLLTPMEVSGELISWSKTPDGKKVVLDIEGINVYAPLDEQEYPPYFPIYLEDDGLVPLSLLCKEQDQPVRRQVRAILNPEAALPLTAREVRVQSEPPEGVSGQVVSVEAPILNMYGGDVVEVLPGAVVLDLDTNAPISVADIEQGDQIVYYGLEACSENESVDFYAFIVLIKDDQ